MCVFDVLTPARPSTLDWQDRPDLARQLFEALVALRTPLGHFSAACLPAWDLYLTKAGGALSPSSPALEAANFYRPFAK